MTAIIVIPNERQCEDQVWLKHRTFAMLLTRSLCSCKDLGKINWAPYRVENSPSDRRVDPVCSLVPAAFDHDVSLFVTA